MVYHVIVQSLIDCLFVAAFVCVLTAAEMAWSREALLPLRDRLRVLSFALIYIPVGYVVLAALGPIRPAPLFHHVGLVGALVAVLSADFCYYWYHRMMHAVPWLWRIHSVHHSAEKLGAGSGYQHVLEAPLRGLFVSIPASFLFGGQWTFPVLLLVSAHGYYVHSTTRLSFGRFAWALCDNRVHRIHHSREERHFDTNFGIITLLWDRLFGTAYFPGREWPAVGVEGQPEPRTALDYLLAPLPREEIDRPRREIDPAPEVE